MTAPKGRAQTQEQKRDIVERLFAAWAQVPALRLGQLIGYAQHTPIGYPDLRVVEDFDLAEAVEGFAEEIVSRRGDEP